MTTKISGANISSIGNTGLNWQAVTVADGSTTVNATSGNGYLLDTNAGVIEVFLPTTPTRGDTVVLADYSGTFATNRVIVNTGGVLIDSTATGDVQLTTNNIIAEFVYIDSAKGWLVKLNQAAGTTPSSALSLGNIYDSDARYITATGGTITTSGDYKIHTFTGDGCFVVSCGGNPAGSSSVDYLVVAGGGGGGTIRGGGGGAGGFRESHSTPVSGCYTASPIATPTGIAVTATTYPITVGAGGAGNSASNNNPVTLASQGSSSIFSTITSAGGSYGGNNVPSCQINGGSGGSGGGAGGQSSAVGGSGNTPPVNPPQGNSGGNDTRPGTPGTGEGGGGGGGATVAGANSVHEIAGDGGDGGTTSISASPTAYAGGGGGGTTSPVGANAGTGGTGGGGAGGDANSVNGTAGTTNRGGGGGGGGQTSGPNSGGTGGKGIVIIRYKYQ